MTTPRIGGTGSDADAPDLKGVEYEEEPEFRNPLDSGETDGES